MIKAVAGRCVWLTPSPLTLSDGLVGLSRGPAWFPLAGSRVRPGAGSGSLLPSFPECLEAFVLRHVVPPPGASMATEASKDATQYPGHAHTPLPSPSWSEMSDEYTLRYPLSATAVAQVGGNVCHVERRGLSPNREALECVRGAHREEKSGAASHGPLTMRADGRRPDDAAVGSSHHRDALAHPMQIVRASPGATVITDRQRRQVLARSSTSSEMPSLTAPPV
jgi:hypothetical protein